MRCPIRCQRIAAFETAIGELWQRVAPRCSWIDFLRTSLHSVRHLDVAFRVRHPSIAIGCEIPNTYADFIGIASPNSRSVPLLCRRAECGDCQLRLATSPGALAGFQSKPKSATRAAGECWFSVLLPPPDPKCADLWYFPTETIMCSPIHNLSTDQPVRAARRAADPLVECAEFLLGARFSSGDVRSVISGCTGTPLFA